MAKHAVVIVSDKDGLAVKPSNLLAYREDDIYFQNLTDHPVVIKFSPRTPFAWSNKNLTSKKISDEQRVQNVAGSYHYDVEVQIQGETVYAHASRPKIIIHDIFY